VSQGDDIPNHRVSGIAARPPSGVNTHTCATGLRLAPKPSGVFRPDASAPGCDVRAGGPFRLAEAGAKELSGRHHSGAPPFKLACSQTKEIRVTDWFQIRAKQPVVKGIIAFGPGPTQSYRMRSRSGWKEVGHGSFGCVMRLHRDTTVLFSPSPSEPLRILYEGEAEGRLLGALDRTRPPAAGCDGAEAAQGYWT
jgi:hypothetical protein